MNKVAIVTGGSSGIGRAVSIALAEKDFHVVVVGRTPRFVDAAVQELDSTWAPAGVRAHLGLLLDVAIEDQMQTMAAETLDEFGRIDLLVASAGVGKKAGSGRVLPYSSAALPKDEWEAVIGVNLTGTFLANRAVLPAMMAQGCGHIINICSSTTPSGLRGTPFAPAYSASKFGVVGLTESLAAEVESKGIRVQAVFPGPVDTPLVDNTRLAQPFGGAIAADHFAAAVMYLVAQPTDTTVVHPHVIPFRGAFGR